MIVIVRDAILSYDLTWYCAGCICFCGTDLRADLQSFGILFVSYTADVAESDGQLMRIQVSCARRQAYQTGGH